jgi:hypothetical protein
MILATDPQYRALATKAARVLHTNDADIIAAILAQWQCEKGNNDPYPPVRNNPGNVARKAASTLGFPFTVPDLATNPQPGNPIVTFRSSLDGANAYGKLLDTGSRYERVRKAVKAGDGHAFILAMGASGFGSSTKCMLGAYRPPPPASSGGTQTATAVRLARLWQADPNGILRPIQRPTPAAFTFTATVGLPLSRMWAPGPKSMVFARALFRNIASEPHRGLFIRISDQGVTYK